MRSNPTVASFGTALTIVAPTLNDIARNIVITDDNSRDVRLFLSGLWDNPSLRDIALLYDRPTYVAAAYEEDFSALVEMKDDIIAYNGFKIVQNAGLDALHLYISYVNNKNMYDKDRTIYRLQRILFIIENFGNKPFYYCLENPLPDTTATIEELIESIYKAVAYHAPIKENKKYHNPEIINEIHTITKNILSKSINY